MFDESCFDFCGGQTVTTDIDNIVDTAADPVVAFMITSSSVTGKLSLVSNEPPQVTYVHLRSSPYKRLGMCPYIAYGLPRLYGPCWAMPA